MRRTRRLLWTLIAWAGGALLLGGCSQGPAQEAPTPTPIPTPIVPTNPIYTVQRGEVVKQIEFTGLIAPVVEQELFFRTGGRVRNVFVQQGDSVTADQVLADLEIDDLERELAFKQLALSRAQITLEIAKAQAPTPQMVAAEAQMAVAQAEARLDQARRRLNSLLNPDIEFYEERVADVQEALTQAQQNAEITDIAGATAALEAAQENLEHFEETLAAVQAALDGCVPTDDDPCDPDRRVTVDRAPWTLETAQEAYDDALNRVRVAEIQLEQARAANSNAIEAAEERLEDARQDLAWAQRPSSGIDLALAEADVALAEATLAEAQTRYDAVQAGRDPAVQQYEVELAQIALQEASLGLQELEAAIADAQIVAPFNGQVLSFSLTEGREVNAYRPVAIIADLSELEVSANLADVDLRDLVEGMPVTAVLAHRPGQEIAGEIRRLPYPYGGGGRSDGVEEQDESTRVTLATTAGEAGFERGDRVRVTVVVERKQDVLWLPPQAIRTFGGREFVVVQDGALQRRLDVELGIRTEDQVEIESGLTEGQVVIGE